MILLASTSVVRACLLKEFGIDFIQKNANFNEDTLTTNNPKTFVYQATMGKYKAAFEKFGLDLALLVADTIVSVDGKIQRKPKDIFQARNFLEAQSGSNLDILTAMIYKTPKLELIDISRTHFQLKKFDPQNLDRYLDSLDWQEKAGGVMVEGFHKSYIKSQIGLRSTAMGLSVEKILPFLEII